jgi:undecaprenyl pyrophosphate phosphatase UppP
MFIKLLLSVTGLMASFLLAALAFLLAWPAMLTAGTTLWLSEQMGEQLDDWERIGLMAVAFVVTAVWTALVVFLLLRWLGIHIHTTPL